MSELVNNHIFDFQKTQREKILKSYGIDIEKSKGEGSRGGKVIGHTKSGKAIYAGSRETIVDGKSMRSHYDSFSKQDHLDAAESHAKIDSGLAHSKSQDDRYMAKKHRGYQDYHQGQANTFVEKSEPSDELKKAYEVLGMTNIFEKGEEVKMDKKDFVNEHENLIEVLKTPTKKDDKKEIREQSDELEGVLNRDK